MTEKQNENYRIITRRIGSTTYKVKVFFKDDKTETMQDKILRMIRSEALENGSECGIMEVPQMSRPA